MARVIFIDKLMRSGHGHFLEYAVRFGRAFEKAGYTPVYLGNRKFKGVPPRGFVRAIEFDFEKIVLGRERKERLKKLRALETARDRASFRERLRLSSLGVAAAAFNHIRSGGGVDKAERGALIGALLFSGSILGVRLFAVLGVILLWPFRALWRAIKRLAGRIAVSEAGRWLAARFARVGQELALREQIGVSKRIVRAAFLEDDGARAQVRSTAAALARLRLTPNDIIICSTVKEADLEVFLEIVKSAQSARAATWNFIFREPIFLNEGPNYVVGQQHRGLRTKLLGFKALEGLRTAWWTDTEELAHQYTHLGAFEFGTLPIAMPSALHAFASDRLPAPDAVVTLGYFGDARPEKGYPQLPDLMKRLSRRRQVWVRNLTRTMRAKEETARVMQQNAGASRLVREQMLRRRRIMLAKARERLAERPRRDILDGAPEFALVAQSNFNVPDGVRPTRAARYRLMSQDDIGVEVILEPPESEDYVANIGRCDAAVLYYTHPLYHAGSSGVFAECIYAGRPVVTVDNSWGGRRLRSSAPFVEHLWRLIEARRSRVFDAHAALQAQPATPAWRALGANLTHIGVRAAFDARHATDQVQVTLEFEISGGTIVKRRRNLCSRIGRAAALVETPEDALLMRVRILRLNPTLRPDDWRLEICGLDLADCGEPLGAIGQVISDADELAPAIVEIGRHRAHYRRTASAFAEEWAKEHELDPAVGKLLAAAGYRRDPPPEAPRAAAPAIITPEPAPDRRAAFVSARSES